VGGCPRSWISRGGLSKGKKRNTGQGGEGVKTKEVKSWGWGGHRKNENTTILGDQLKLKETGKEKYVFMGDCTFHKGGKKIGKKRGDEGFGEGTALTPKL